MANPVSDPLLLVRGCALETVLSSPRMLGNSICRCPRLRLSVGGHLVVDVARPGIDTARQVDHIGKSLVVEVHGDLPAADAVVTDDHRLTSRIECLDGARKLTHRDQLRTFDLADPEFPGFAHVQ